MTTIGKNDLEQVWKNACGKIDESAGAAKPVLIGDILREVRALPLPITGSDEEIIQMLARDLGKITEQSPDLAALAGKIKEWETSASSGFMTRIKIQTAAEPLKPEPAINPAQPSLTTITPENIQQPIISSETPPKIRLFTRILSQYKDPTNDSWCGLFPKSGEKITAETEITQISGGILFPDDGVWKIHISVDPNQMEDAIKLISSFLLRDETPRLGIKIASEQLLKEKNHQTGKELALLFDKTVEQDSQLVQKTLTTLWQELNKNGIQPEPGNVLTTETISTIKRKPEKKNLITGKFDRAIPCPNGKNYFHYRYDAAGLFDEPADFTLGEGVNFSEPPYKFYRISYVMKLAQSENPEERKLAHNPLQLPDPFINIRV